MFSIPLRFQVAFTVFLGCFISYMLRVDISIYVLDMVAKDKGANSSGLTFCQEQSGVSKNNSLSEDTRPEGFPFGRLEPFPWGKDTLARLRGAYFWGYMIMNLPGGTLAEKFGSRLILITSFTVSSVLTLVFPLCAYVHWSLVFIIRMVIGLAAGVCFPAYQTVIARWAPPKEKAKFTMGLLGGNLGTVVAMPLLGFICTKANWVVAAVTAACLTGVGTFVVFWVLRDTPDSHPRISPEELDYIKTQISTAKKKKKLLPPYKKIILNRAFWGLLPLQFGNVWGIYFLMTSGPQYMKDVLGFNPKDNAILSALPHLARLIFGVFFSFIGDWLRKKDVLSITVQRKIFTTVSHLIPGVLLVALSLNSCSVLAAVLLTTLSLGLNGSATVTSLMNAQDLSPNFAGTIFGIVNCVGSASGVIIGEIVGALTKGKRGEALMKAWRVVFVIGGIVYIASGIIFDVLGSGKTQDYNDVEEGED